MLPVDLPACFENLVAKPEQGPMSKRQLLELVGNLKRSELEKSLCGKRLITWYNELKKAP